LLATSFSISIRDFDSDFLPLSFLGFSGLYSGSSAFFPYSEEVILLLFLFSMDTASFPLVWDTQAPIASF